MGNDKRNAVIAILIVIVLALVIALAYVLNKNVIINNDTSSNNKIESKENKKDEEKEEEKEKEDDKEEEISIDGDALAKKAYDMLPNHMGLAEYLYLGKKIDLTTLDPEVKFAWTLDALGKDYKIPVCYSENDFTVSRDQIEKYSLFEDNSYIDAITNKGNLNYDDNYLVYSMEYKNGKYSILNTNCDGRGTGHTAFERFDYESHRINGDKLELFVGFAYFDPSISDYENEHFANDIKDSYSKDARVLKKDYEGEGDLTKVPHAVYKFTFKVVGDKLYPLTVEME